MTGFSHDIAGGNGNLIAESVQSPNFIHGVQGWRIARDGSAEFQDVILPSGGGGTVVTFSATEPLDRKDGDVWYNTANGLEASVWSGTTSTWVPYQIGTGAIASGVGISAPVITGGTIEGASIIANGSANEYLAYNGTPAAGNLVLSVSPVDGTDSYGNMVDRGFAMYGDGTTARLNSGFTPDDGTPSIDLIPPGLAHWTLNTGVPPAINGEVSNPGAADETLSLVLQSGAGDAVASDVAVLTIQGRANDGSLDSEIGFTFNGTVVAAMTAAVFQLAVPVVATQPGSGGALETWHDLPVTLSGWANTSGNTPLQYRMLASPPNTVQIMGDISGTAISGNGAHQFATLPAGYYPAAAPMGAPAVANPASTSTPPSPLIWVTNTGALDIYNGSGATRLVFNFLVSLDGNTS